MITKNIFTDNPPAASGVRSPFRYPGGKSKRRVADWVISYCPRGIKEYREPFVGGGGVFFGLHADRFDKRWINDLHTGLMSVYEALRDRPEEFIASCRSIEPAREGEEQTGSGPRGGKPVNKRLREKFDYFKLNTTCDQALRYYFVHRTVYGGRVNYALPSRLYFSNPAGWNIVETDALENAAKHLAGVRVTCSSYERLLTEKGDHAFAYLDPPYVLSDNLCKTSQLYQHCFTRDDHIAFAEACRATDHRLAISYGDDPDGFVRSLFEGFHIEEAEWAYCGSARKDKTIGKELLIMNYHPTQTTVPAPSQPDVTELTRCEKAEREELEGVISAGLETFFSVGAALMKIRDDRLYRSTHSDFDSYCRDVWSMTRVRASQLISAAQVVDCLQTKVSKPTSESHCRPLAPLLKHHPDTIGDIWQETITRASGNTNGHANLTAKLVTTVRDEMLGVGYVALRAALDLASAEAIERIRQEEDWT